MSTNTKKNNTVDSLPTFNKHHYYYKVKTKNRETKNPMSIPTETEVVSIESIFNSSNTKIVTNILSFLEFKDIYKLKTLNKNFKKVLTNKKILREYALKGGISSENRLFFYETLINIQSLQQKLLEELSEYNIQSDIYNNILTLAHEKIDKDKNFSYISEQIKKDLNRTFYTTIFKEGNGTIMLNNILTAIAFVRPEIGYCQGMNFIVGSLINFINSEEKCFWIFLYFIDSLDLKKLYLQNVPEFLIKLYQLNYFINEHFPDLMPHLKRNQINLDIFFGKWILTIFSNFLPFETLYHIWDLFIIDKWKAIFKFSIIIMNHMKDKLMIMNSLSFSSYVRNNANIDSLKFSDLSKFYNQYKITNKQLFKLREDFLIDQFKSKLEINESKLANEHNIYISNYQNELYNLSNDLKLAAEIFQQEIDLINIECEQKLKQYEQKQSKVNRLKAKIEQEIEIKVQYENSLKQLTSIVPTKKNQIPKNKNNKNLKISNIYKKAINFSFDNIKHFIKKDSNEYEKIIKKINNLNKEIDNDNKTLIIECQKLDKKQICYEKILKKRNETQNQMDAFLRKSELAKRELIKNLYRKLNPTFFD